MKKRMFKKPNEFIWKEIYNWTIVSIWERICNRLAFNCKCTCWKEKNVLWQNIRLWLSKSCWCLHDYSNITTHWMHKTKIYWIWHSMIQRCRNINNNRYQDYGWRWITYEKKRETFEWFYEDMWVEFKQWLQIDRIDNNWNYCKQNCKWVTPKEQSYNRRNTRYINYKWKIKTINEWAKEFNCSYGLIYTRLYRWLDICPT